MRVALGGGDGARFLVFASYDNRHAVCDALSPVWLSDALIGGALMYGLALLSPARLEASAWDWRSSPALIIAASTRHMAALPSAARGRFA